MMPLTTTMLFVFVKASSEAITFYKKAWILAQSRMEEVLRVACKPENYHHCHASCLRKAGTGMLAMCPVQYMYMYNQLQHVQYTGPVQCTY